MRIKILFFILLLHISCKKNPESINYQSSAVEKFDMYQMSEMASLMEFMYADNLRIKESILKDDLDFGKFPELYKNINNAILTDPSDRDAFFESNSISYIDSQRLVYEDRENVKHNFNNMVNNCIECHQIKCAGPISRIKKLLIL